MRYRFELATPDDDAELRRVLRMTPMDGKISVTFQREPSFFAAAAVDGPFRQVVVCRDHDTRRIIGFGCRSVRSVYVNGVPVPIGYLSSLRVLRPYRNLGLVARGYKYFRGLHADHRTELYLTTIAQGNDRAIELLTSARAGLPRYHYAGQLHTCAIPLPRYRLAKHTGPDDLEIRPSTKDDLPVLMSFLSREGPRRQFFPAYQPHDFFGPDASFKHLRPADLNLAFHEGQLVGTLAGWDQHRFRQTVVNSYATPLRWTRPVYNGWAAVRGLPVLPRPGRSFRYINAALPLMAANRLELFPVLLERIISQSASCGADYLLVGLHESDPLLCYARDRCPIEYVTRLYYACWDGEDQLRVRLDDRPVYLELGTL